MFKNQTPPKKGCRTNLKAVFISSRRLLAVVGNGQWSDDVTSGGRSEPACYIEGVMAGNGRRCMDSCCSTLRVADK